MTSSVINRLLHPKLDNILYEPSISLLDNIIYQLPYYFFVFRSNDPKQQYSANSNNTICLMPNQQDFYDYRLNLCHDLEHHARPGTIANAYHINTVLILNTIKNYKKEDRHIINQNIRKIKKVFLNNRSYEALGKPNDSIVVSVGIPTNIFKPDVPISNRQPVAILDRGVIGAQIKQLFANNNTECDVIDPTNGLNIKGLNHTFNRYKVIIDLGEYCNINLLCALSCGCRAITLGQNFTDCPFIEKYTDVESVVKAAIENKTTEDKKIKEYIDNNHNFEKFADAMNNILKHTDKEAYIQ